MIADERVAAGTANVALLALPALAVASWVTGPWPRGAVDVVSATLRAGYDPWSNYLQFAVFVGLVGGAFVVGYRRGTSLVEAFALLLCGDARASRPIRGAAWALFAVAAVAYVVNAAISSTTSPLVDDFHEGEYLGFIPLLRAGGTLASALTVHGPGVDLLPAYAAVAFAGADDGIVVARIAYAFLRAGAVLTAFAGLALLCRLLAPDASKARWAISTFIAMLVFSAALRVGNWPDELPLHKPVNARDAIYLVQIALVLAFVHAMEPRPSSTRANHGAALLAAILAGATLSWGPVYSYDRGLYGVAFLVLVSLAMAASAWRGRWLAGVGIGITVGTALLFLLVPRPELAAVVNQIAFWVAQGRELWSQPGIAQPPDPWIAFWLAGGVAAIGYAVARIVRSARALGIAVVTREPAAVVMLAAALPCLRMAIERSDTSHVSWAVTPAWMLAAAAIAAAVCTRLAAPQGSLRRDDGGHAIPVVALSLLVGFAAPLMDPAAAMRRITGEYLRAPGMRDDTIISPAQRDVRATMLPLMAGETCFVTLTNESTWYYVLGTPSCTRFHHVTNARLPAAQAEVIAALERTRPRWILFANQAWSNTVDGVSLFNASPALASYIMTRYVPARTVAGNAFWQRSEPAVAWSDERVGHATRPAGPATHAADARIEGTIEVDPSRAPPPAIMLTTGDPARPLWSGQVDARTWREGTWFAIVPTAALPPGNHRLQAWAFAENPPRWIRLGEPVDMRIEPAVARSPIH